MKTNFLELCSLILNVDGLNNEVEKQRKALTNKIEEFNRIFDLKKQYSLRWEDDGVLMTPVPFAAPPINAKYALVGLNPKFDEGEGTNEKLEAGTTWDKQSEYYNSWKAFKMAFRKDSSYYINRMKFFHSLKTGKTIEKEDILKTYNCNNYYDAFESIMLETPTIFAEFIPFHSISYKTLNIEELEKSFENIPGYRAYLLRLISVIDEKLPKDGIIIFDGKNPSEVYKRILEDEIVSYKKRTFIHRGKEKFAYEICKWNDRLVVFTGGTIYGSYTAVNGERIKKLVEDLSTFRM